MQSQHWTGWLATFSLILIGCFTALLLVLDDPLLRSRIVAEVQLLSQQPPLGDLAWSTLQTPEADSGATPLATATPAPTALPTATPPPSATPSPPPTPVLAPVAVPEGGHTYLLAPVADGAVGWASNRSAQRFQFGDYNLYAGHYQGESYVSAVQFDLSAIPPGAPVVYADLTLTGLSAQYREEEGAWQVELLAPWIDERWATLDYYWLARAESSNGSVGAPVHTAEVAPGVANHFVFSQQMLPLLTARTYMGRLSVRLRGSEGGDAVLFAWDSGFGLRSQSQAPLLRLVTGPAPLTPPPSPTPYLQVVTPESLLASARRLATATAEAAGFLALGTPASALATATPLPPYWVTPIIVVETPTPTAATTATAEAQAAEATARAFVYGTPTPRPPNVWTATPVVTGMAVLATPDSGSRALCSRYGLGCGEGTPAP